MSFVGVFGGRGGGGGGGGSSGLTPETTRTVTLSTGQSTAQIQSAIDAIGKYIPAGVVVTVQFPDGTITPTSTIEFAGFFGGGELRITGNLAESTSTQHTNQTAIVAGALLSADVLRVIDCKCLVTVQLLRVNFRTSGGEFGAVKVTRSTNVVVQGCYLVGAATTNGEAIFATSSNTRVQFCMFTAGTFAMYNEYGGLLVSTSNSSTGTSPSCAIGTAASISFRSNATQPASSSTQFQNFEGGQSFA